MRASPSERAEVIDLVENSDLSVSETLMKIGIPKSTFYRWYSNFLKAGPDGLVDNYPRRRKTWNSISPEDREKVIALALKNPDLSCREVAAKVIDELNFFVSESSVYRILKAENLVTSPQFKILEAHESFPEPTKKVHELWQTDFTYFKVESWGWFYLSTVMDDYSRYIIAWELCDSMKATDAIRSVDQAIELSQVSHPKITHRPKLLSDNGSCYVSSELKRYLDEQQIGHTRGKPYHPMTQGKIERYHRSMKSIIKLEPYFYPEDLNNKISAWVEYYNNQRYHSSLKNLTPADVYFGVDKIKIRERDALKRRTLNRRRAEYFSAQMA